MIDVDELHRGDVENEDGIGYHLEDGAEALLALSQPRFLALAFGDVDDRADEAVDLASLAAKGREIRQVMALDAGLLGRLTVNLDVEHRFAALVDGPV